MLMLEVPNPFFGYFFTGLYAFTVAKPTTSVVVAGKLNFCATLSK